MIGPIIHFPINCHQYNVNTVTETWCRCASAVSLNKIPILWCIFPVISLYKCNQTLTIIIFTDVEYNDISAHPITSTKYQVEKWLSVQDGAIGLKPDLCITWGHKTTDDYMRSPYVSRTRFMQGWGNCARREPIRITINHLSLNLHPLQNKCSHAPDLFKGYGIYQLPLNAVPGPPFAPIFREIWCIVISHDFHHQFNVTEEQFLKILMLIRAPFSSRVSPSLCEGTGSPPWASFTYIKSTSWTLMKTLILFVTYVSQTRFRAMREKIMFIHKSMSNADWTLLS